MTIPLSPRGGSGGTVPFIYNKAKVDTSLVNEVVRPNGETKALNECSAPLGVISSYCNSGHISEWPMRCRNSRKSVLKNGWCNGCANARSRQWMAKLIYRFEYNCSDVVKEVFLWTFGTALLEGVDNVSRIKRFWTLFRKRINSLQRRQVVKRGSALYIDFKPLLYVIEKGFRAGRLHIHCITWGYLPQDLAKDVWRSITNEGSNVNYSPPDTKYKDYKPLRALAYCAKYLNKALEPRNWYWMGLMLKKVPNRAILCPEKRLDFGQCGDYLFKFENLVFGETIYHNSVVVLLPKVRGNAQKSL